MTTTDVDLTPDILNITVRRGDAWSFAVELTEEDEVTPINLTGATVAAQLRATVGDGQAVNLDVTITSAVNGQFTFGQDAANGSGVYDVEVTTAGGAKNTYIAGALTVKPDVTRP